MDDISIEYRNLIVLSFCRSIDFLYPQLNDDEKIQIFNVIFDVLSNHKEKI